MVLRMSEQQSAWGSCSCTTTATGNHGDGTQLTLSVHNVHVHVRRADLMYVYSEVLVETQVVQQHVRPTLCAYTRSSTNTHSEHQLHVKDLGTILI